MISLKDIFAFHNLKAQEFSVNEIACKSGYNKNCLMICSLLPRLATTLVL